MSSDTIRLDLPAQHKYLNILGACITSILTHLDGLTEIPQLTYNIELAVQEVCTNIVRHAYVNQPTGRIDVTLTIERHPLRLTIDLRDEGKSFNITKVPAPNLEEGQVHGYGLFLIQQLMDEVTYEPQPGHNHWRLVKNL